MPHSPTKWRRIADELKQTLGKERLIAHSTPQGYVIADALRYYGIKTRVERNDPLIKKNPKTRYYDVYGTALPPAEHREWMIERLIAESAHWQRIVTDHDRVYRNLQARANKRRALLTNAERELDKTNIALERYTRDHQTPQDPATIP